MRISNPMERAFYEIESINNRWSKRELERQFKSSLFERLAVNKSKDKIKLLSNEGEKINENKDLFRDPFIFEFIGLPSDNLNNESKLETELINKVEHFLLEFGKYFTFVARQKRITIEDDHFYVDIVLYNRYLRCFVLVDLKMGKLTHQDLGQIQMYTNYFDKYEKLENENNTIGIVLCRDKNESMIKISLPNNDNIFASRFTTVFPNKSELKNLLNKKM